MCILILKDIDSTKKSKRFSSQSNLQAFKRFLHIQEAKMTPD